MSEILADSALVLVFILIGGVFAATELALVSLREAQLTHLAERSPRGARVAAVARDPNRFLAAVQIGVTVAGFFSAAFGASTLAEHVSPVLHGWGMGERAADTLAVIVLTLVIAYVSLVLGELVPKRIALQRSTTVAVAVGPGLDRFASLMRPVVWLLSISTDAVVRLLGLDPSAKGEAMTEAEIRTLVAGNEEIPADERALLDDVFAATDRSVTEVMTPRRAVTFLRGDLSLAEAVDVVRAAPFSRYPVIGRGFDDVRGYVHVRDVLEAALGPTTARTVRAITRDVLLVPGTNRLLPTMAQLRSAGMHLAVVVDEYGGTDGIVTLEDLVEEVVGEIHDEYDLEPRAAHLLRDGVADLDAGITIEDAAELTGLTVPDGPYETLAGYVLARLGRLASVGDTVDVDGRELTVTEVEGLRISRVTIAPEATGPQDAAAHETGPDGVGPGGPASSPQVLDQDRDADADEEQAPRDLGGAP